MKKIIIFAVAALVASAPVFAQQSEPSQPAPAQVDKDRAAKEGSVNDRRQDQQQRIAGGVQSGQLTAGETKNLESREANVNREVHADRSANGGKLTTQERGQVNRQQNNISKSIYTDKHNNAQQHYGNSEVGKRQENQQDRIANGVKNGSMSAGEAARTENREQGINQQVRADRAANGGRLTGQERSQVNKEQNHTSHQIYREKHNGTKATR